MFISFNTNNMNKLSRIFIEAHDFVIMVGLRNVVPVKDDLLIARDPSATQAKLHTLDC